MAAESLELAFRTKNPKQIAAAEAWLDPDITEILYGGAKGGAKSYTGASLIFGTAHTYPGTQWYIARKELIDLKKFTIPTIHEVHKNWGFTPQWIEKNLRFDGQLNVFTLPNGSKVFLIACDERPSDPLYERFGSMQMTGGWIEEAGEVPENAKANLSLAVGRWKNDEYDLPGKTFITANPKKGWMKRDFVDPFKAGTLAKNRCYIQAFATDNAAYLPAGYIEKLRNEKDTVRRQRLWEGDWDYSEDKDSLVEFDALTDAFTNTITKDGERYLVVDVARKGRDSTVFSFWDGLELYKIEKRQKQTTEKTEQQARDFAAADRVPYSHILVDEDGIGGGVVDHLMGVKGFTGNSTPVPTAQQIRERVKRVHHSLIPKQVYANLKAQCGWKASELINEHKIAFKVPDYREEIIGDLSAMLRDRSPDAESKKLLRDKADVKEEIGRSPDVGDTILMRAWFELVKESGGQSDEVTARAQGEQEFIFARNRRRQSQNSSK